MIDDFTYDFTHYLKRDKDIRKLEKKEEFLISDRTEKEEKYKEGGYVESRLDKLKLKLYELQYVNEF